MLFSYVVFKKLRWKWCLIVVLDSIVKSTWGGRWVKYEFVPSRENAGVFFYHGMRESGVNGDKERRVLVSSYILQLQKWRRVGIWGSVWSCREMGPNAGLGGDDDEYGVCGVRWGDIPWVRWGF